jgi:hypothetical protein
MQKRSIEDLQSPIFTSSVTRHYSFKKLGCHRCKRTTVGTVTMLQKS